MKVEGRTAVVTGAGSGIGRALAIQLVRKGCSVALCDINIDYLKQTQNLAFEDRQNERVKISIHKADVSKASEVKAFEKEVVSEHGNKVHLLFANAGIGGRGELIHNDRNQDEIERFEECWDHCFRVNSYGVLYSIRSFLPHIIQQDEGYVIIISSIAGFWTVPGLGAYASSKFAVCGLAESLLCEAYVKTPHVKVASVHPGKINTDIVKNTLLYEQSKLDIPDEEIEEGARRWKTEGGGLSPDEASEWILRGIAKDKTRIMVGYDSFGFDFAKRIYGHGCYDIYKVIGRAGIREFENLADFFSLDNIMKKLSILDQLRLLLAVRSYLFCLYIPMMLITSAKIRRVIYLIVLFKTRKYFPFFSKALITVLLVKLLRGG